MGEFGASSLYGQYADYKAYTLEVAGRRYQDTLKPVKFYGEGTIGIGFIEETDVLLVAPRGQYQRATDFYDQTAAFTFGINAGALFETRRLDLRPGGSALHHRHVRGGRPRRHRARDHQRQQRPLDLPNPDRRQVPVLVARRAPGSSSEPALRVVYFLTSSFRLFSRTGSLE